MINPEPRLYTFLSVPFNIPDIHGDIMTKESIDIEELNKMRNEGKIYSYKVTEEGLYISLLIC